MIYNFDYYNRFEEPTLILCNPDDSEIGVITNFEGLTPNVCFSDISDISYRINWVGDFDDFENNDIYEKHIERRQVHVCGVGYFIITDVSEVEDDDFRYKNISAKSCEYELNNINMPYINGTYQLYKVDNFPDQKTPAELASQGDDYMNDNCLLYEIMKTIPSWTLKGQTELANSVLGKSCRTFESTDVTIYSFLRNELADSYECFVEFDIEKREIYLHEYENFFTELPMVISNENFLNSCEIKTTIDNYVNSLKVEGASTVSISNHNPMGGSTIYNFKHDKDIGLIDGELKEALNYWESKMTNKGSYNGIRIYEDESTTADGKARIENWVNSRNNLSKVKTDLIELIADCAKNNTVDKIWEHIGITFSEDGTKSINPESKFLVGFGMDFLSDKNDDNGNPLTKRTEFIYEIANIIAEANIGTDDESSVNTSAISNLFYDMQFYLSNVLCYSERLDYDESVGSQSEVLVKPEDPNDNYSIISASKELIFAQQFKTRLAAEIENMTKIYNGFEAEREALKTTGIENGYNYYQETEGGEWKYTTPSDATEKLINELNNLVTNLNITEKYLKLSAEEKSRYETLLGTDENTEDITTTNLVNNLSNFIKNVQDSNGFKSRFAEYYNLEKGCDETTAAELADKLYTKLTRYLKQQTYTDENIVITESMSLDEKFTQENDLYMHAVSMLNKISEPAYEININAETFMFIPELIDKIRAIDGYENVDEVVNIKNALHIRLSNGDTPLFHILKITTNYDEQTCELTMGNRLRLSDPASVFTDLQRTVTSAASVVASERFDWGLNKEKINDLMTAKSMDIDTTQRAMTNSVNDVTFGDFGLKCYAKDDNGNPIYGMWMANGTMMFMNENGSAKAAIGRIIKADGSVEYGFHGESVLANSLTVDKFKAGTITSGTNLIRNGSFEYIQGNKAIFSTNFWEVTDGLDIIRGTKSSTHHLLGSYSAGIPEDGYIQQSLSTLQPGTYMISFDMSTSFNLDDIEICLIDSRGINILNNYYVVWGETNRSESKVYKKFEIIRNTTTPYIRFINKKNSGAVMIDGVMLELSEYPNEYSPHISEHFAKYTTIDDKGIAVYNGKISISNNSGLTVFYADENGDLTLNGGIFAKSGKIGGWHIGTDVLYYGKDDYGWKQYNCGISASGILPAFWCGSTYSFVRYGEDPSLNTVARCLLYPEDEGIPEEQRAKFIVTMDGELTARKGTIGGWTMDNTKLYNKFTGMDTDGQYVFYAGDDNNYNFSVTQSGKLFAREAKIDKELTLTNEQYNMVFDGYSILMRYGDETTNNKYSSAISFTSTGEGLFGTATNNANLAIAGSSKILFGTRPEGEWKALCEIEHLVDGKYFNSFYFKPCTGIINLTDGISRAVLGSATNPWSDLYLNIAGVPTSIVTVVGGLASAVATGSVYDFFNTLINLFDFLIPG